MTQLKLNLKNILLSGLALSIALYPQAKAENNASNPCGEGKVVGFSSGTCIPSGGSCGSNCSYTLDNNGNLHVFPTVAEQNAVYDSRDGAAELYMSPNIKNVVIDEGITTLEYDSFAICDNIESMQLPNSLTTIGGCTFQFDGKKLGAVIIPPNVTSFSAGARSGNITFYCSANTISQCGANSVKYSMTDDGKYMIYDSDDKIVGVYSDLDNILSDTPVESYNKLGENGLISTIYDGRGNEIGKYTYDGARNVTAIYKNGVATYKRTSYTPAEAAAAANRGNNNTITFTFK